MIVDITAKYPLEVCENVVTVPEVTDACPYEMVPVGDWNGEPRYQCPQCPHYRGNGFSNYGQCEGGANTTCKIALARTEGFSCPLGYRSPK